MLDTSGPGVEAEGARRLLVKLRRFAEELDPDERALLGALLAPGIAQAYPEEGSDEVAGFEMTSWSPAALPEGLAEAVRGARIRVVGL